jgi:hypothetical protein
MKRAIFILVLAAASPAYAGSGFVNLSDQVPATPPYWDDTAKAYVLMAMQAQGQQEHGIYADPIDSMAWGAKRAGAPTVHFQSAPCGPDFGTNNGSNSACVSVGKCIAAYEPNATNVGLCIGVVAAHEATEVRNGIDECDAYESIPWHVEYDGVQVSLADCTLPKKFQTSTGFKDMAHQVPIHN